MFSEDGLDKPGWDETRLQVNNKNVDGKSGKKQT
jgi:hypothetical protein